MTDYLYSPNAVASSGGSSVSASYALTASYASNGGGGPSVSASYATTSSYALVAQTEINIVTSASYALTASYAPTPVSVSYASNASAATTANTASYGSGSFFAVASLSSSYATSASYIQTASAAQTLVNTAANSGGFYISQSLVIGPSGTNGALATYSIGASIYGLTGAALAIQPSWSGSNGVVVITGPGGNAANLILVSGSSANFRVFNNGYINQPVVADSLTDKNAANLSQGTIYFSGNSTNTYMQWNYVNGLTFVGGGSNIAFFKSGSAILYGNTTINGNLNVTGYSNTQLQVVSGSPTANAATTPTLTSSIILSAAQSNAYLLFNPGTSSLAVNLPTHSYGLNYTIMNLSTTANCNLTVLNTSNVTQSVIRTGSWVELVDDGSQWWVLKSATGSIVLAGSATS